MNKLKLLPLLLLVISTFTVAGQVAAQQNEKNARQLDPRGIVVDNGGRCPKATYTTIQAAVNAARSGDTIQVCPGVYREQIRIAKPLTVVGVEYQGQSQVLIQPNGVTANSTSLFNGTPAAAIVLVDTTARVTLENLTVDGANNNLNACSPFLVGIFYRNASGTVDGSAVRNIVSATAGCQNGYAIFAQSGNGGRSNLTVTDSSVHDYDKAGIQGNEIGTTLNALNNAVTGRGSVGDVAQNGIQIGFGAGGRIEGNSVINHLYAPCVSAGNCPFVGTNIVVVDSNDVSVQNNNAGKSQDSIYIQGNRATVAQNVIFDTDVFDGLNLVGNGNTARGNRIFNSDESGVFVQGNNNLVQNNFINETPVGILEVAPSRTNDYRTNRFFNTRVNIQTASVPTPTAAARNAADESPVVVNPFRVSAARP